jgi:hypothetical protein
MSVEGHEPIDWDRITFARARVLREIEDHRAEREIADKLQMTYNGVRSQIDELKSITGCSDLRALGRWWRDNRPAWLAWCDRQARVVREEGAGA